MAFPAGPGVDSGKSGDGNRRRGPAAIGNGPAALPGRRFPQAPLGRGEFAGRRRPGLREPLRRRGNPSGLGDGRELDRVFAALGHLALRVSGDWQCGVTFRRGCGAGPPPIPSSSDRDQGFLWGAIAPSGRPLGEAEGAKFPFPGLATPSSPSPGAAGTRRTGRPARRRSTPRCSCPPLSPAASGLPPRRALVSRPSSSAGCGCASPPSPCGRGAGLLRRRPGAEPFRARGVRQPRANCPSLLFSAPRSPPRLAAVLPPMRAQ